MINPRVEAFCPDFPWRYDKFIVRDTSWVDLDRYPNPTHPYFYNDCIQVNKSKKQKGNVFKPKQFTLQVVVPEAQWKEYEAYINKLADEALASEGLVSSVLSTKISRHGRGTHPTTATSFATSIAGRPLSYDLGQSDTHHMPPPSPTPLFLRTSPGDLEPQACDTQPLPAGNRAMSLKRHRQATGSISSVHTLSPPQKKAVTTFIRKPMMLRSDFIYNYLFLSMKQSMSFDIIMLPE